MPSSPSPKATSLVTFAGWSVRWSAASIRTQRLRLTTCREAHPACGAASGLRVPRRHGMSDIAELRNSAMALASRPVPGRRGRPRCERVGAARRLFDVRERERGCPRFAHEASDGTGGLGAPRPRSSVGEPPVSGGPLGVRRCVGLDSAVRVRHVCHSGVAQLRDDPAAQATDPQHGRELAAVAGGWSAHGRWDRGSWWCRGGRPVGVTGRWGR